MCDVLQFIPGVPGSHKHLRRLPNLAPNHAGPLVEAGKLSNVIMSSHSAQWANTGVRPSYEILLIVAFEENEDLKEMFNIGQQHLK